MVSGEISPRKLVSMTPEQLATPELAQWREQESRHVSVAAFSSNDFVSRPNITKNMDLEYFHDFLRAFFFLKKKKKPITKNITKASILYNVSKLEAFIFF